MAVASNTGRKKAKKKKASVVKKAAAPPSRPFIPQDQLTGITPDRALAADLVELTAFFAADKNAKLSDLVGALDIGQDEFPNVNHVLEKRDAVLQVASDEIAERSVRLGDAYPFSLNNTGSTLTFREDTNWGRTLYILSLIISHLPSESPVLERSGLAPTKAEIVFLRRWFQYCATASLAAEIGGDAWAFGWPRPDHSGFLGKLREIWLKLKDGTVLDAPGVGAPLAVKDDEVDIIAARSSCDGHVGFPIVLGQVASGGNWKDKSLRGQADHVFYQEWFAPTPCSQTLVYHIVPFVVEPDTMRRQTRRLGHLMPRTRLCARALEAATAIANGATATIEGQAAFGEARAWEEAYRTRMLTT